jgi:hypothetical protein
MFRWSIGWGAKLEFALLTGSPAAERLADRANCNAISRVAVTDLNDLNDLNERLIGQWYLSFFGGLEWIKI